MYDSEDDYDSDEEPEFLSSEEEMEFLSDQQHDASLTPKTKQSVWGVIDKTKLAKVQVRKGSKRSHSDSSFCTNHAVSIDNMCLLSQDESLAAVQSILGCSCDTARKLLTHFQWNKEALFGIVWACQLCISSVSSCTFLTSSCAGTLADRSEEAVYQSAGVTSRSDAEAPDGKPVNLQLHNLQAWPSRV